MAGYDDPHDDEWGTTVAKWTTICTVVLAVLYVGAVFLFILPH